MMPRSRVDAPLPTHKKGRVNTARLFTGIASNRFAAPRLREQGVRRGKATTIGGRFHDCASGASEPPRRASFVSRVDYRSGAEAGNMVGGSAWRPGTDADASVAQLDAAIATSGAQPGNEIASSCGGSSIACAAPGAANESGASACPAGSCWMSSGCCPRRPASLSVRKATRCRSGSPGAGASSSGLNPCLARALLHFSSAGCTSRHGDGRREYTRHETH